MVISSSNWAAINMGTRAPSPSSSETFSQPCRDSASSGRTLAHGTPSFTCRNGAPRASSDAITGIITSRGRRVTQPARVLQKFPPPVQPGGEDGKRVYPIPDHREDRGHEGEGHSHRSCNHHYPPDPDGPQHGEFEDKEAGEPEGRGDAGNRMALPAIPTVRATLSSTLCLSSSSRKRLTMRSE